MKIAEIIAREGCLEARETEMLLENISSYIDNAGHKKSEILAGRAADDISPVQLKHFFRNREREENTRHILQYLLMFLQKVPNGEIAFHDQIAPEKQLREFVGYQVDLLLEKDVKKAILREYSQLGILRTGNFWYYEGRITDLHRELSEARALCTGHGPAAIIQLCQILEKLCLFWFDLCCEDMRRVRASDIFIFKLTLILGNKMAKTE